MDNVFSGHSIMDSHSMMGDVAFVAFWAWLGIIVAQLVLFDRYFPWDRD